LIGIFALSASACAAEVSGTVAIDHQGLFGPEASAQAYPVSVALVPDQGQAVQPGSSRLQRIEIRGNRMHPPFLTIQKGDRVEFINRDTVFHQLFSLSRGEPLSIQLGKAGGHTSDRTTFDLTETGTTHFFCRIHNKSYARIDVVDTPYLKTIQTGQSFHFSGLAPGRWQLRLASPAAETRWIEVRALTSPPPLQLILASRDGGKGPGKLKSQSGIEQLYR
jgi:plastocyanin